jgi:hypothetical protein
VVGASTGEVAARRRDDAVIDKIGQSSINGETGSTLSGRSGVVSSLPSEIICGLSEPLEGTH